MIRPNCRLRIGSTHRIRAKQVAGAIDSTDACPTFVEVDGMVVVGVNNTSTKNTSEDLGYNVEGDFLPREAADRS